VSGDHDGHDGDDDVDDDDYHHNDDDDAEYHDDDDGGREDLVIEDYDMCEALVASDHRPVAAALRLTVGVADSSPIVRDVRRVSPARIESLACYREYHTCARPS
jgi:hypothetical protein